PQVSRSLTTKRSCRWRFTPRSRSAVRPDGQSKESSPSSSRADSSSVATMVISSPMEFPLAPSSMIPPSVWAYAAISENMAPQLPWRYDAGGGREYTRDSRSATKAADSEPGSGWKTPKPGAEAPISARPSATSLDAQGGKG